LPPGKYEVGFELDANNDSIWQSMNPLMQQIPEPYFYIPEVIDVRSNWDVEMDWSLPLDSAKLQINEETELK
jgi:hypothetical protein